jgi:uncharacterized protein YrrD
VNTYRKCHGRTLVSLREGALVGKLDDFQFDLESRRIYGYRVKAGGVFGKAGGVKATLIERVGRDVAFVDREESVEWNQGGRNAADGRAWASQYKGTRVMSRSGKMMGQVHDIVFDDQTLQVFALFLDEERWIALEEGEVATGPAAVIVGKPDALQSLPKDLAPEDVWTRFKGSLSSNREEAEE